jgi:hypothetical protein
MIVTALPFAICPRISRKRSKRARGTELGRGELRVNRRRVRLDPGIR